MQGLGLCRRLEKKQRIVQLCEKRLHVWRLSWRLSETGSMPGLKLHRALRKRMHGFGLPATSQDDEVEALATLVSKVSPTSPYCIHRQDLYNSEA